MKPCDQCPWSKLTERGRLGGSPPEVYVGQVVQPFWLPCHESRNYEGKASDVNKVQDCRGAAIFRANIGYEPPRPLLILPPDNGAECFTSLAEFYAFHANCTLEQAQRYLTVERVAYLAIQARNDPKVRAQIKIRK